MCLPGPKGHLKVKQARNICACVQATWRYILPSVPLNSLAISDDLTGLGSLALISTFRGIVENDREQKMQPSRIT